MSEAASNVSRGAGTDAAPRPALGTLPACATCGRTLGGPFCAACGQRVVRGRLTVLGVLAQVLGAKPLFAAYLAPAVAYQVRALRQFAGDGGRGARGVWRGLATVLLTACSAVILLGIAAAIAIERA